MSDLNDDHQETSDDSVLLETIRDLAKTRERLGRASGHITAARVHQEEIVRILDSDKTDGLDTEKEHLAALVAAEKEIAEHGE